MSVQLKFPSSWQIWHIHPLSLITASLHYKWISYCLISILCWVLCCIHHLLALQTHRFLSLFFWKHLVKAWYSWAQICILYLKNEVPPITSRFNFGDCASALHFKRFISKEVLESFASASVGCGCSVAAADQVLAWGRWLRFAAQQFYLPNPSSPVGAPAECRLPVSIFQVAPSSPRDGTWAKAAILSELDFASTQLSVNYIHVHLKYYICLKYYKYKQWSYM